MTHPTHRMHENSLATFNAEEAKFATRAAAVVAWFRVHGKATDRECMRGMGFTEPNAVRPRITELIERGELSEHGTVRCPKTGRPVRLVGLPQGQGSLFA